MIGLDVSDRSIKVVEISGGVSPRLRTTCWSPVAPNVMRRGIIQDANQLAATLEAALTKCTPTSVVGKSAVVSIPETQSFVRVLDLPAMSNREMDEAVQWAIRQHIPFDLDRVYIDWQPVTLAPDDTTKRRQVLVGAAQRDVVDPLLSVIDGLGIQVVALELEAQAIVRSLLPLESSEVTGVLLVDLGATSTNIIYFDRGAMRFTTSIQRGGDDLTQRLAQELRLEPSIAAEKKALVGVDVSQSDPNIAATLREATKELVLQISQVVREVSLQLSVTNGVKTILLAGGASNLPGLAGVFSEVFPQTPVQLGNPLINLVLDDDKKVPPLSPADSVHFTTAIGLALRPEDSVV